MGTLTPRQPACPRVAFFPDSYYEINGVAHTSRQFEAYSRRRGLPFLCERASVRDYALTASVDSVFDRVYSACDAITEAHA